MYIPLFNTTNYTLLSSLLKIDDLIQFSVQSNISSIAITDSNMFGTMEFIKKCEKSNIKPIIGLCTTYKGKTIYLWSYRISFCSHW